MSIAGLVGKNHLHNVPAVIHADGSCRVQTVSPTQNGEYHALIDPFDKITGCPILLNTSFNDQNEPIVETYQDAISCFLRTGLDALYVENQLIEKTEATPEVDPRKMLKNTHRANQSTNCIYYGL